jgi:C4-type Zn-finger protein
MQNFSQEPSNTVCPVCGATADDEVAPVIVPHQDERGDAILRIGTCCEACRCAVVADPQAYFLAAADNRAADAAGLRSPPAR